MDFSYWLSIEENVLPQRDAFFSLVKSIFPKARFGHHDEAIVKIAGRTISMIWVAGVDYTKDTDPSETTESYVKIDFFYQAPQRGDDYDFIGDIRKDGVAPESTSFARVMYQLVRGIKRLGIHIMFDASGRDRADSYASVLQKAGFTLGKYAGIRQIWLAHPIEGMNATNHPYSGKWSPADLKRSRPAPTASSGIQIRV